MRIGRFCVLAIVAALAGCRHAPPKVAATPPVIVENVTLEGFDVLPVVAREALEEALPLRAGMTLTSELEKAAGDRAVEILQNYGYPYAQLSITRVPVDATRTRLVLRAEPGTRGFFGKIDIAGNRNVDDAVIRRRLAYAPGDLFRRSAIETTQQRIGQLGLFKSVEIRAHDIDLQPAEVPTLITVVERSPWRWNLSAGYAAGEKLGFEAGISHLNFFGAARRFDLRGRVSEIERTGEVAFTQTEAWHESLSLSLQARHQEIDEPSFFTTSSGGQAAVSWQWTKEFAATGSYAVARERSVVDESLETLLGLQDGILSAWSLDLDHRHVDTSERAGLIGGATDGWLARLMSLHVEQAGEWMPGTFNYFNLIGDVRQYRRAFRDRVVFAGRFRYGAIDGADSEIPLLKRFFLGGATEMRGWGVYEVSPLSASGEPVGGRSMMTAIGEMRIRTLPRLTVAFFAEAGNAWEDPWAVHLNDLLYDLGPGVRLETPFGLIRFDFGYQLKLLEGLRIDGQPQEHRWRINFGIGEAF